MLQVLLALERIEQDEELTYEVILLSWTFENAEVLSDFRVLFDTSSASFFPCSNWLF